MVEVKIGTAAPEFALQGTAGGVVLADFRTRKNIILYFYPKDDTPG